MAIDPKIKETKETHPAASSGQAVEAAIDASKFSEKQTWEQGAQRSNSVPPWAATKCGTKPHTKE